MKTYTLPYSQPYPDVTLTHEQIAIIRAALSQSGCTHRLLVVEAIGKGQEAIAGFYASLIAKNERAAHIAWSLPFPCDDESEAR